MDVLKLVRGRRPEMLEHVNKNETAIKITFENLEKAERRLIEARQDSSWTFRASDSVHVNSEMRNGHLFSLW